MTSPTDLAPMLASTTIPNFLDPSSRIGYTHLMTNDENLNPATIGTGVSL